MVLTCRGLASICKRGEKGVKEDEQNEEEGDMGHGAVGCVKC